MMREEMGFGLQSREQRWLFSETMKRLDEQFDEKAQMLGNEKEGHGVRDTAHYALGLLARGGPGDKERAHGVVEALLKMQYDAEEEDAFYGGFCRDDREQAPPCEPFPGTYFNSFNRYYLEKWQESIFEKFGRYLAEEGLDREKRDVICRLLESSICETVPVVWKGYDPNWREFIAVIFAMILYQYEGLLETDLVRRMEKSMMAAVKGSLVRYENHVVPMNTNIELMHIFICDFYGDRLGKEEFRIHAGKAARHFLENYREFHSVAEYNSTTYYSVDLMALSLWRQIAPSRDLREIGSWLEGELWRDIAAMYQPELKNLCGPYSRCYEADMSLHSLLPAYLYLGLGEEVQEKPAFNCELAGCVDTALLGTRIPEDLREGLLRHKEDRYVRTRFRELMERSHPEDDTSVCTATAWIGKNYMIGALEGSRNTSGQLRPAAAFWKMPGNSAASMVLMRREPGGESAHMRTVYFHGQAEKGHMEIGVDFLVERDVELFFAVKGKGITADMAGQELWKFPGMTVSVKKDAPEASVRETSDGIEIVYLWKWKEAEKNTMFFELDFQ